MSYIYRTKGTCATAIEVELDGDIIKKVRFNGGCNGNLKGISCPDQLAKALTAALEEQR